MSDCLFCLVYGYWEVHCKFHLTFITECLQYVCNSHLVFNAIYLTNFVLGGLAYYIGFQRQRCEACCTLWL